MAAFEAQCADKVCEVTFVNNVIERILTMSLELMNHIFSEISNQTNWAIHLLSFKHHKNSGSKYNCRKIELQPVEETGELIRSISDAYIGGDKGILSKYLDVRKYDGTCLGTTIYKIEDDSDIYIDIQGLFQGIADSDTETDPMENKYQAYILCSNINYSGENHGLKLISMNNPFRSYKEKLCFSFNKGNFKKFEDKLLHLRTSINVVIFDKTVYFLDMAGETLFNMERAYKKKCLACVQKIETMSITSDFDVFKNIATTGHNPRRFVSFNENKLNLMNKNAIRNDVSKKYGIPLTNDGKKFDTSQTKDADRLVKVLCDKAMWDIIEKQPMEVDASKKWE